MANCGEVMTTVRWVCKVSLPGFFQRNYYLAAGAYNMTFGPAFSVTAPSMDGVTVNVQESDSTGAFVGANPVLTSVTAPPTGGLADSPSSGVQRVLHSTTISMTQPVTLTLTDWSE